MSTGSAIRDFTSRYLERAREHLAESPAVAVAIGDRGASAPTDGRLALAGWWTSPEHAGVLPLPNPWDDREAVELYDDRSWELHQAALRRLAGRLDDLHGTTRPYEYWDVLLAPWMLMVAAMALDRELFVSTVNQLAPDLPFADPGGPPAPPATTIAGVDAIYTDDFNRGLVADLARRLGSPVEPVPVAPGDQAPGPTSGTSLRSKLHTAGWLLPRGLARMAVSGHRRRRLTMVGLDGLSPRQVLEVARRVPGLRVAPSEFIPGRSRPPAWPEPDPAMRRSLAGDDDVLDPLLASLVPVSVVEGHALLVEESERRFGPPSNVLHGNYSFDDTANEFAARSVAAGRRLHFGQHGGCSLQLARAPAERHEHRPGSTRLTWGGAGEGVRAVPSPYVQRLHDSHRGGTATVVIEALTPPHTWVNRFTTTPLGSQVLTDQARLPELVSNVGPPVSASLVLKRFPGAVAPGIRAKALAALPTPPSLAGRPATEWMRQARIVVVPYPDTPLIEAMAIGVPVIGVWDHSRWVMREDARRPFERLAELGVFHDDPRAAAAKLEEVYEDAGAWWASPELAAARRAFLERFAILGDWRREWVSALDELAAG